MCQGGVSVRTVWDVERLRQYFVTRVRHLSITKQGGVSQLTAPARRVGRPPQEGAVYREAVDPRQQQPEVLAMLVRPEWTHVATTFDLHHCILHR